MKLQEYKRKRNFQKTPEPRAEAGKTSSHLYVIQKHAASHLHYDFRLALNGVLKSWAVPKGPSLNPDDKRLAVHVEDHPLDYGAFEGIIPQGQYGGGTVMLWDRGAWVPDGDPEKQYEKGHLRFELKGQRLRGNWSLIRMGGRASAQGKNWLLVKEKDDSANASHSLTEQYTTSVVTRRSMEEIAAQADSGKARRKNSPQKIHEREKPLKPIAAASTLPLAKKAPFPDSFKPQLAVLSEDVPTGEEWIHEVKYDGYRLLAFIHQGRVRLLTRNELDWTHRFPSIASALEKLPVRDAILDGEIVVQKKDGTTDFQALQNALRHGKKTDLTYYLFDLPYCDGEDLKQVPLIERKKLLKHLLESAGKGLNATLRYSDHIEGEGAAVIKNACHYALEGILSKRVESAYQERRSGDWLKIKCGHRQEFVLGGYTKPKGSRKNFGSLLLGTYNAKGELTYAGHVGTGFDHALLETLFTALYKRRQQQSPFNNLEDKLRREVTWTKPDLVAEIQFAGWTNDGLLRHPTFEGLREDKKAREVILERPAETPDNPPASSRPSRKTNRSEEIAGVTLTHPDRVLYPEQGITKKDLCLYYEQVAKVMLPHLKGRPLSLVRCPRGEGQACFFQKHFTDSAPDSIRGIEISEKNTAGTYILVDDVKGLISLVQLGVLEFHPWPCAEQNIERPDRLIFDLDPSPEIKMAELVQAALHVRDRLKEAGLISFVKTTGGKGLHVVAPVQPTVEWDDFKKFAGLIANDIVRKYPGNYIATMSKAQRAGKIFIDYFRNGRGATSIASYSSRSRPGATVSTPLDWKELTPQLKPELFTVRSVPARLTKKGDAWRDFFNVRQRITESLLRDSLHPFRERKEKNHAAARI